jgi:hypothetical protein
MNDSNVSCILPPVRGPAGRACANRDGPSKAAANRQCKSSFGDASASDSHPSPPFPHARRMGRARVFNLVFLLILVNHLGI